MSASFESAVAHDAFAATLSRFARSVLFLAVFLLFWVSVNPFHDLTDPAGLAPSDSSNVVNQAATVLVALATALFMVLYGWRSFVPAISLPLVLTLSCIAVAVAMSADVGLSMRRYLLALLTILMAIACLQLPEDRRHFAGLLMIGALVVLVLCYAGVLLAPHLSVHQLGEPLEPEHAGSWRGLFIHKNQAGAAMALLVFAGIYIARVRSMAGGTSIVLAAVVFFVFTRSKGAIGIFFVALILSFLVWKTQSTFVRGGLVIGGVGVLTLLTVGSAFIGPVKDVVAGVMADPSFTNRDDIWRFAVEKTMERPLFGHGFEAFWRTPAVVYSGSTIENWAAKTTDAHNGYLNLAVTTGLVTLAVAMLWLLAQPIRDIGTSQRRGNDPALEFLFVQVWVFGILYGCLETVFFVGGGPMWITLLIAILGLRMNAERAVIR